MIHSFDAKSYCSCAIGTDGKTCATHCAGVYTQGTCNQAKGTRADPFKITTAAANGGQACAVKAGATLTTGCGCSAGSTLYTSCAKFKVGLSL